VEEAAACIISFPARGGSINATANSTGKKLREAALNGSKCTPAMDEAVPFSNSPRGESCIRCSECMDQLPVFDELVSHGPFVANREYESTLFPASYFRVYARQPFCFRRRNSKSRERKKKDDRSIYRSIDSIFIKHSETKLA